MIPKQFIFVSTLSVFALSVKRHNDPITEADKPCPNTAYGFSKLKANFIWVGHSGFSYIIYRPTGVYGPREKDYFLKRQSPSSGTWIFGGFSPSGSDLCICQSTLCRRSFSAWKKWFAGLIFYPTGKCIEAVPFPT